MNPFIQPNRESDELPVLHRLAIAYLVLPLVIWLVGWFEWWFGFPSAVLLVLGLWRVLSGTWQDKDTAGDRRAVIDCLCLGDDDGCRGSP